MLLKSLSMHVARQFRRAGQGGDPRDGGRDHTAQTLTSQGVPELQARSRGTQAKPGNPWTAGVQTGAACQQGASREVVGFELGLGVSSRLFVIEEQPAASAPSRLGREGWLAAGREEAGCDAGLLKCTIRT